MKPMMRQIAGDMSSSMVQKGQYQQCARKMFSPALHDSAQYLLIRLSCKYNGSIDNRLLIESVYIKCLECDSEVCVNINKEFSSSQKEYITLFYQTHIPRIIIYEFYNRYIFE